MKQIATIIVALLMLSSFAFAEESANMTAEDNATTAVEETAMQVSESLNENQEIVEENASQEAENQTLEITAETAENESVETVEAQPVVETEEVQTTEVAAEETPSITPDEPVLWGLKRAIERIDLLLTFNKAAKAQKGLVHARERLLEVSAMIEQKKFEAAEKAAAAHAKDVEKVKKNIEEIEENNGEELAVEEELKQEVEEQSEAIEKAGNRLKIKIKGELTPEQQTTLDALIGSFAQNTAEIKIKIEQKRQKTEVKIRAREAEKQERQKGVEEESEEKEAEKPEVSSEKSSNRSNKGRS